eukprot:716313_1
MSRLSEARRCFSVLAFILILVTLFGSHLPWMMIAEEEHEHKWTISEEGGDSDTASFYMDMYFNLLSVEACQTFLEDSSFFFKGQVVCSVMPFSDSDKNTVDIHDWSMYGDACESAGLTAFVLLIASIAVFTLVICISTFKNCQRKCCPKMYEQQHGRAKCIVPSCAAFAPIAAVCSIVLYFVQCINHAAGHDVVTADNVGDVQRSATGYEGFWIAMTGALCLVCWWILFTIWFCGKKVGQTDFSGGNAGALESDRTVRQKQPIAQDSDEENSRMELAPHSNH